jgi:hypothetical protein
LLGIQQLQVSFARLTVIMISGLLTSSTSHSPRCTVHGESGFEGLVLQVGAWTMSSNWNDEDVTAKY